MDAAAADGIWSRVSGPSNAGLIESEELLGAMA